jgi:hypothetical protein
LDKGKLLVALFGGGTLPPLSPDNKIREALATLKTPFDGDCPAHKKGII